MNLLHTEVEKETINLNGLFICKNNYKRFREKKIITCIFTLDSDKSIFIDFNILKENPTLKDSIKKYIINKYSEKHDKIYDYYLYCKENKPNNIDSIT